MRYLYDSQECSFFGMNLLKHYLQVLLILVHVEQAKNVWMFYQFHNSYFSFNLDIQFVRLKFQGNFSALPFEEQIRSASLY